MMRVSFHGLTISMTCRWGAGGGYPLCDIKDGPAYHELKVCIIKLYTAARILSGCAKVCMPRRSALTVVGSFTVCGIEGHQVA